MSVEIDWDALTTGPDGLALAESIRDFIHEKFQQVQLPKFIRSVRVHSFEFGDECPTVVLKDVCDPLDEFYEDSEEEEEYEEEEQPSVDNRSQQVTSEQMIDNSRLDHRSQRIAEAGDGSDRMQSSIDTLVMPSMARPPPTTEESLQERRGVDLPHQLMMSALSSHDRAALVQQSAPVSAVGQAPRSGGLRTIPSFVDQLASPLLSRSGTPGIPGGTANLSYFHHGPFPHRQNTFPAPWSDYNFTRSGTGQQQQQQQQQQQHALPTMTPLHQSHQSPELAAYSAGDPSTRPSTATTQTPLSRVPTNQSHQQQAEQQSHRHREPWTQQQHQQSGVVGTKTTPSRAKHRRRSSRIQYDPNQPKPPPFSSPPRLPSPSLSGRSSNRRPEPNPQDLQLVLHVRYSGGVRLALSAEILLDYPMSSFVSIPLQLTITGISFDGVAIMAHVRPPLSKQEAGQDSSVELAEPSSPEELTEEQQVQNRGRAHICFLSPEDARALLGADAKELTSDGEDYISGGMNGNGSGFPSSSPPPDDMAESPPTLTKGSQYHNHPASPSFEPGSSPPTTNLPTQPVHNHKPTADGHHGAGDAGGEGLGGLLREIRVESEIGQRREGQQSLRNVGKVEKFVLEQVRRIFEDEFVWPSFWTFLL